MPITQSRMIALANAGQDYKQAYEVTWQSIQENYERARLGAISWEDACRTIYLYSAPKLRVNNLDSAGYIMLEQAHFRSQKGRNNRAAKSARKKRLRQREETAENLAQDSALGVTEPRRTTAPQSLVRELSLHPVRPLGEPDSPDPGYVPGPLSAEVITELEEGSQRRALQQQVLERLGRGANGLPSAPAPPPEKPWHERAAEAREGKEITPQSDLDL